MRPASGGPGTKPINEAKKEANAEKDDTQEGGGGGGDDGRAEIDPIIRGLLMRLPKSGDLWPDPERKLWLQLLEGSLKLIYKDKEAAN